MLLIMNPYISPVISSFSNNTHALFQNWLNLSKYGTCRHRSCVVNNKKQIQTPLSANLSFHLQSPSKLRDVKDKAYEPKMVAIGPYHHGKDKFKTTEELKVRCFQSLLLRKPDVQVAAIAEMEKRVRDCYAERISLNAAEFTVMLVLDGCFVFDVIMRRYEANDRNAKI